jgi:hypothetical protein
MTIVMLTVGLIVMSQRLRQTSSELSQLRREVGYLSSTSAGQIAAVRAPSDQPLTYRIRVRVPEDSGDYRVAYSSHLPKQSSTPMWYGAVPIPSGESLVTVRILEDPRDKRWKIATIVSSRQGTQWMSTALPPEHVTVFRGSHDVLSKGVGRETQAVGSEDSIRLLDERWLVGGSSLLLYGDRAPETDQIGVYAELQPDIGPLSSDDLRREVGLP